MAEEYEERFKILGDEVTKIHKKLDKKEKLPMYLAANTQQMLEELEAQGLLGAKPEEGLQDDFANAFRMFTDINERGDLMQGLVNDKGRPASLIDLYQTMDLRGVVWNYGLGWISALKGGYNSAVNDSKRQVQEYIAKTVARKNVYDYLIGYFADAYKKFEGSSRVTGLKSKASRRLPKLNLKVYD
jgi:hypothetical protein